MPGCHVLALDLGSSGVRSYLGVFDGSRLDLTLIHEQANGPVRVSGHWYWNILGLHETILAAMREAARRTGGRPFTVGIETWGVDFGLIDSRGELLSPVYHYRDPRTHNLFPEVFERISDEVLYAVTGVPSLAIKVLGGVNPNGGSGTMVGLVMALATLQIISSGLNVLGASSHLTMALWGAILILVTFSPHARAWLQRWMRARSSRRSPQADAE